MDRIHRQAHCDDLAVYPGWFDQWRVGTDRRSDPHLLGGRTDRTTDQVGTL